VIGKRSDSWTRLLLRCLREVSHDIRHVMPSRALTTQCNNKYNLIYLERDNSNSGIQ
jgi:hypothetical protein